MDVPSLVPLMDDTPLTLASFYGPMFTAWGVAGAAAYGRTRRRLPRAALSGATVALVTLTVLTAIVIARVNLSLDLMSQRGLGTWSRIPESGFDSFRVYVNYVYISGAPFKLPWLRRSAGQPASSAASSAPTGRPGCRAMDHRRHGAEIASHES